VQKWLRTPKITHLLTQPKRVLGETQHKHRGLNPLGQIRDRCNPGAEEFLDGYSIGQAVMALSIVAIGRMVSRMAKTVF